MSYIQKKGKDTAWRGSLMRNLASELILHEKLQITDTRAKELRTYIDKLITLAKRQDLHSRRQAESVLRKLNTNNDQTILQKLFSTLAARYKERNGGYTRILKLGNRKGDNALMVIIELVK